MQTLKKSLKWVFLILILLGLFSLMFLYSTVELFPVETEKILNFKDIRNGNTYTVHYSSGDISDYESIVIRKKNKKGIDELVGNFEHYKSVCGFSIVNQDSVQIILSKSSNPSSSNLDTFYLDISN